MGNDPGDGRAGYDALGGLESARALRHRRLPTEYHSAAGPSADITLKWEAKVGIGPYHGHVAGGMAEWSMAVVLKTIKVQAFGGSNPSPSVFRFRLREHRSHQT